MIDADLDRTIDRIVDGGLSPAQLREAAALLDTEPDAWKRCALAFLEAQCWTDALREPGRPQMVPKIVAGPAARSKRIRPTMAAAALVAFAMGWLIGGRPNRPDERPAPVVQTETHDELAEAVAMVDEPDAALPQAPPEIREVGRLRFATGPDGASPAEVPILAGPGLDPQWLMNQPMPVSDRERAALEQQGYALDQERQLVAMPLADGRQVVVPVDQVRLRYVGTESL